uniref:Syntaxin 10 n=1 Tax=Amphiprion ocellaris TaxID=80972 RepID=A0AAQ5Y5B0_AMPOC
MTESHQSKHCSLLQAQTMGHVTMATNIIHILYVCNFSTCTTMCTGTSHDKSACVVCEAEAGFRHHVDRGPVFRCKGVSRDELDWSANELRNCLRAIDWDLEDLSETISIVESNPGKFRLGDNELQERRDFVERTRKSVQEMKDQLSSPSAVAQAEKKNRQALLASTGQDRSTGLEAHLVSANSRYIQEQQEQQQLIMQEQDEQLELVSGSIRVLKDMSGRIGDELDEQAVMLGDFGDEMDQTSSRMDSVLKKLEKVSHMTSSRRQWCAIGVLVAIMIVVLILFFAL